VGRCGTRSVPLSHEGMLTREVTDIVRGGARPERSSAVCRSGAGRCSLPDGPNPSQAPRFDLRFDRHWRHSVPLGNGWNMRPHSSIRFLVWCSVRGCPEPHGRGEPIHPVRG
jgi:hypothetical protein